MENCATEGYVRNDIANVLNSYRKLPKAALVAAGILSAAIGAAAGKVAYEVIKETPHINYEIPPIKPSHLRYKIPKDEPKKVNYHNII